MLEGFARPVPMPKLALLQLNVVGGEVSANIKNALSHIKTAANQGADVLLLPETFDLGWTHPSAKNQAEPVPLGLPTLSICEAAKEYQVYICAGVTEKEAPHVYNTAILVNPEGEIIAKHRKINELDIGHDTYSSGHTVTVTPTPIGNIGIMICADGFARGQVIARTLGYLGADIILSPCAWAVPADHNPQREPYGKLWRDNYIPVARDFAMWICGVSNVGWISGGPWQGRKCIGCSMVIDPDGREVLQGPYGHDAETILYVDVKLRPRPARGTGWDDYWAKIENK
jgi:predicted amidohydrolase